MSVAEGKMLKQWYKYLSVHAGGRLVMVRA